MIARHVSFEFHFIPPERTRLALLVSARIVVDTTEVITDPLIDI